MGQEGLVCVPGRLLDHLAHGASKAVSIAVDGTRGLHGVANVAPAGGIAACPTGPAALTLLTSAMAVRVTRAARVGRAP